MWLRIALELGLLFAGELLKGLAARAAARLASAKARMTRKRRKENE
jgi:hypothetical protein